MREIKFRLWSKSKQEMIYPLFGWFKKVYIGDNGFFQDIQLGTAMELNGIKLELLQYTGLKDKNGMEIYEGDILQTDLDRPYVIVEFRNGAFMYQCHDNGKEYYDFMLTTSEQKQQDNYLEIIGNIYENPELLTS